MGKPNRPVFRPPSAHPLSTEGERLALYSRVSTLDQRPGIQADELRSYARRVGARVAMDVREKGSGARSDRPGLQRVLQAARKGEIDTVVVHRLDRWGRSVSDVLTNIRTLESAGVRFLAVAQGLDVRPDGDAVSKLTLTILSATAAFELDLIRERTRAGLQAARRRGVTLGRPRHAVTVEQVVALRRQRLTWQAIAAKLGCTLNVARLRYAEHMAARARARR